MNMFKAVIIVIGGLLLTATGVHPSQIVKQSDSFLNRQTKGAHLQNVMVGQAFVNALVNVGAPGGVATVSDCNGQVTYVLTPRDPSLRGVLDSIVSTDPRYTWEVKDDVINVLPSDGLPPFFGARISKFEIFNVATPNEALFQLLAIPEVRQARLKLGRHAVQGGGTHVFCPGCPTKETKKISVNLKGVTVREALNAISRAHGTAVWKFSYWECRGQKSFSLDFAAQ
jgi:hypothetical protein